jgi:hypothetical protein
MVNMRNVKCLEHVAPIRLAQYGKITKATETEKSHAKPQSRKEKTDLEQELTEAAVVCCLP